MVLTNHGRADFLKHCRKRRKCWEPEFFPLPSTFATLLGINTMFSAIFDLLSVNASNLEMAKIMSSGEGLMLTIKIDLSA